MINLSFVRFGQLFCYCFAQLLGVCVSFPILEVKGTGTANQCSRIECGSDSFAFKPGKYYAQKFCLEPTSFNVKAEGVSKNAPPEFQNTKLMTRLTYTPDKIESPFDVSPNGTAKFEEKDGIDYADETVQLPGGVWVPLHKSSSSWRPQASWRNLEESSFCPHTVDHLFWTPREEVDPKGMTMPWRCQAVADEMRRRWPRRTRVLQLLKGTSLLGVSKTKPESGKVIGVFESGAAF